jgi:trehalose 6-phosphate phosphatase
MRYLFDCWEEIARRIRAAKDVRLFLDFDGTLVGYRPRPEQVKLREKTRLALRRLAEHRTVHRRVHVAIVSGRRRGELAKLLRAPSVEFLGLYGWEDVDEVLLPSRTRAGLTEVRKLFAGIAKEMPGIFVEDKGISVAVHFRDASKAVERKAHERVRKIVRRFRADLHVIGSKSVWDVVPKEVRGKGVAMRNALAKIRKPFLAIYAGDDVTDEPAFKVLSGGITVLVGEPRKTHARFRLRDPLEVYAFLRLLEAELL